MTEAPEKETTGQEDAPSMSRRSLVAALASIPVFGVFLASFLTKKAQDDFKRKRILDGLGVTDAAPAAPTPVKSRTRAQSLIEDRLGMLPVGNHRINIDTGLDTHFVKQAHKVLGTGVAREAELVLVGTGGRLAADRTQRRVDVP